MQTHYLIEQKRKLREQKYLKYRAQGDKKQRHQKIYRKPNNINVTQKVIYEFVCLCVCIYTHTHIYADTDC